jgi:hypothetical protein
MRGTLKPADAAADGPEPRRVVHRGCAFINNRALVLLVTDATASRMIPALRARSGLSDRA